MIEEDLHDYLMADTAITDLVVDRVFPNKFPASLAAGDRYPGITFVVISGEREMDMDGDANLKHPRIQVNSWGARYADAKALAAAVRNRLHAFRGTMGGSDVKASLLVAESDILNPKLDLQGGDDVPYGVRQDYVIWHST